MSYSSGADLDPRATEKQRIAQRYVVESEIARGGMGVVYKVRELASGNVYALKRIRVDAAAQRAMLLSSFEREYQVLASLDHPGIIRVFDYGVDGQQPYYTMEFVEGRDLRALAPMPWRDACRQLRDVASALSLLHARRLIHRDLSPSNVKVTAEGRSKLLDFGALADFGYAKWVVGTPPLVAPEMLAGGMLDQRADLYALGALFYWLMTGRHAYPAPRIEELPTFWKRIPPAPSAFDRGIPGVLDALVMSMLSANPLARPSSAAEVIAHLNGIAELEPEDEAERQRLARSFLAVPPFVGRDAQFQAISQRLAGASRGRGVALVIEGAAGSGRTRLLEEAGVRAQISGATVLRVDASMHASSHGTSRALTMRLLEALPELGADYGRRHRGALAVLGRDALMKIGETDFSEVSMSTRDRLRGEGELADWFLALSRVKPLVLQVDNAEYVDDASLGLLVTLAQRAGAHPLVLMVVERSDVSENVAMGLRALRQAAVTIRLPPFTPGESLEHVRSMFGDAPNVTRFAEWLHGLTAGNPLLSVELSRQLVDRGVVRYAAGMWELPTSQPTTERSTLLEEVMTSRIERLTPPALELARCLGLSRLQPTFELCALVSPDRDERGVRALLDELARCDIVQLEQGAYRFSSSALREALLATSSDREREVSHLRIGNALLSLAQGDAATRIEAGWHLLRGGQELEGADLITEVMRDMVVVRRLNANMYRIAAPVEAALNVYKRHRREPHARLPLLCGLAQAGFFEDWQWDEAYGDEALDMLEEFSGMRLAKRLRRVFGGWLALMIALAIAAVTWSLVPRRDRPFSFKRMIVQMIGTVLTSCAVAAMRLDGDRAERVADVISPFDSLPSSLTTASVYRFCHGIQQIAREHQVEAFKTFSEVSKRIEDPRYFKLIPDDSRVFFLTAAHFARGAFAIFRDEGRAALESAAVLEVSGLRVMALIGAQIRYLYHMNRGELALASPHRAQVELHAAHFGSAWQVELWESAALLPLQLSFDDATAVTRLAHQLELQSRRIPSLRRYARLSWLGSLVVRNEALPSTIARAEPEVIAEAPRSYIGWAAAVATIARAYNSIGRHDKARALCERALSVMTEEDREYVTLFLAVDLETAVADGKSGKVEEAFARIDGLLARFRASTHPLTVGLLHEARARLAWDVRRVDLYERSLAEVERWFGRSQTPALVAKYERLVRLARPAETVRGRVLPANTNADAADLSSVETDLYETEI
ncbi:MAG: protein kinase [Polyangiales bacterium]